MSDIVISYSWIANPDQQIWKVLIPLNIDSETRASEDDEIEKMIEAGED